MIGDKRRKREQVYRSGYDERRQGLLLETTHPGIARVFGLDVLPRVVLCLAVLVVSSVPVGGKAKADEAREHAKRKHAVEHDDGPRADLGGTTVWRRAEGVSVAAAQL
jgi:hypothetical protein